MSISKAERKKLKEKCTKLVLDGKMIPAIKLWRTKTGCGLKAAYNACKKLQEKQP